MRRGKGRAEADAKVAVHGVSTSLVGRPCSHCETASRMVMPPTAFPLAQNEPWQWLTPGDAKSGATSEGSRVPNMHASRVPSMYTRHQTAAGKHDRFVVELGKRWWGEDGEEIGQENNGMMSKQGRTK